MKNIIIGAISFLFLFEGQNATRKEISVLKISMAPNCLYSYPIHNSI